MSITGCRNHQCDASRRWRARWPGNDSFITTLGTPIIITRGQLLANDCLPDNANITNVSTVSGGTLVYNGNDTWTYTRLQRYRHGHVQLHTD